MPTPTEQGKARGDELRQQAARLEAEVAMYTEQAAGGSTRAKEKLAVAKENLMRLRTALKGKGGTGYKKGGMVEKQKKAEKVGKKVAPDTTKTVSDKRKKTQAAIDQIKCEMSGKANCGASMKPTQKFSCGGMVGKPKAKKK